VTSCAPKLHQITFQGVSKRADLSPYSYTPVNVREQCSWAQTDDHEGATETAIALVRAGVAKTRVSRPLEPLVVKTLPRTMVVGGGVGGRGRELHLVRSTVQHTSDVEHLPSPPTDMHARRRAIAAAPGSSRCIQVNRILP
jgi:heterodisulfide reductase subunit A-like polyferredoxin